MSNNQLLQKILRPLLTVLLILFFIVAAIEKLRGAGHIVENYVAMGLGRTALITVGSLELIGVIGLIYTPSRIISLGGLTTIILLTLVGSLFFGIWDAAILAVIILILLLITLYLHFLERKRVNGA